MFEQKLVKENRGYWGYRELTEDELKHVNGAGCGGCGCGCGYGGGDDGGDDSAAASSFMTSADPGVADANGILGALGIAGYTGDGDNGGGSVPTM